MSEQNYFQTSMLDSYVHHFCHDTHFQLQQYSVPPDIPLINSCRGLHRIPVSFQSLHAILVRKSCQCSYHKVVILTLNKHMCK